LGDLQGVLSPDVYELHDALVNAVDALPVKVYLFTLRGCGFDLRHGVHLQG
jgi:hypothetical protein